MLELTLTRGGKQLIREPIGPEAITIGRAAGNTVRLLDAEISREHCRIEWRDGALIAVDLSRNGMLVNQELQREAEINAGDRITIGPWTLLIESTIDAVPVRTISASPHATRVLGYDAEKKKLSTEQLELLVRTPDQGPTRRRLTKPEVLIGHHAACDVAVADPFVSRRHCRLLLERDALKLIDLASTNGVFVGETRVTQAALPPEGSFTIGRSTVYYRMIRNEEAIEPAERAQLGALIGSSTSMREVYALIERIAPAEATVLVTGESGTGKELVAHEIHGRSQRCRGPFVAINCGALPAAIIESHLLGPERGAFTGAVERTAGVFEQARGGTVFLDEIGEMPAELQTRLLRVLEERRVRRLGGQEEIPVDFRLVAATNRNLARRVAEGRFREDLFYRLHVVPIELPPLRERPEDIPQLARHFAAALSPPGRHVQLTDEALAALCRHPWPGNVRELRNILERTILLTPHDLVQAAELKLAPADEIDPTRGLRDQERTHLVQILRACRGNITRAAQKLGIARSTLQAKMLRYTIDPKEVIRDQ